MELLSESIGFTGPVGTIGDGRYAIVYDECQDGKVQAYDAIFDPAFEVYTDRYTSNRHRRAFSKC